MRILIIVCCLVHIEYGSCYGQSVSAFPSLNIPVSSRGLAMGNTGIASAFENQQLSYNMAKTAFTQNFHQASVSYLPWLAGVSNDTRLMDLNYLANVSNSSSFGVRLRYMDYGSFVTRDNNGAVLGVYRPREYSVGGYYALQTGSSAALGLGLKMIGANAYGELPRTVLSVCGDVGYYQFINLGDVNKRIEWGATVSNLGPKIIAPDGVSKTSLPVNAGVGVGYVSVDGDTGDSFSVALDANKEVAVPGSAVQFSFGAEYGFLNSFFLRGGIHFESRNPGNRKYFGIGVGYHGFVLDQSWGIDFHYLVPFGVEAVASPFEKSYGFTLHLSFGNFL